MPAGGTGRDKVTPVHEQLSWMQFLCFSLCWSAKHVNLENAGRKLQSIFVVVLEKPKIIFINLIKQITLV